MTKEEATRIVDALIEASELACKYEEAQAIRENLRGYVSDMLVTCGVTFNTISASPGIAYRNGATPCNDKLIDHVEVTC